MEDLKIINRLFSEEISERYLSYALSTITSRSLPDVRDGLKPVHRRLIYAMRQLKLNPNSNFKKSARVVGDVMGKFHPHGDAAIYDAMVRMAQEFSLKYPLVDGQGNFGNIDGDNAAAMRYTEAKLTEFAELLIKDIDSNTVDFKETYDGEDNEPVVLPSAIPNLLANGSHGIAVGMATSIPPHNLSELFDACLHLLKFPDATDKKIISFVKGPDLPTGGIIIESEDSIYQTYKSGKGSFRVRSKWNVEKLKNGKWQIIISEIPYQIIKSKLIEKIDNLVEDKKIPLMSEILDESAENIRIVIEPKNRDVSPELLMENLFKLTDLEAKVHLNLNYLDKNNIPGVRSLKIALIDWLEHRKEILERKSNFRLNKIKDRLEVIDGQIIVYLNLDRVIEIIRQEDEPKEVLIKEFKLSEIQANSILDMRLRSLRKLEEIELKKEKNNLLSEQETLLKILTDQGIKKNVLIDEIKEIKNSLKNKINRMTTFEVAPKIEIPDFNEYIEEEPITIILSSQNWIRSQKGHIELNSEFKLREGDTIKKVIHAKTNDKIIFFSENGSFYSILGNKLPSGRGFGEPLSKFFDLDNNEKIVNLFSYFEGEVAIASSDGLGFKIKTDKLIAATRSGKKVFNLNENKKAKALTICDKEYLAVTGSNRKMLVFSLSELPELNKGKGVILQRYKDGYLEDIKSISKTDGIVWNLTGGRQRTEKDISGWIGKRGSVGKLVPNGFPRPPKFD